MSKKLYHASYNKFRNAILSEGLRTEMKPNWKGMQHCGVIYLASDAEIAESFAECADVDDETMESGICIFEVDTSDIDETMLTPDPNIILEDGEEAYSFIYPQNIPATALKLINDIRK